MKTLIVVLISTLLFNFGCTSTGPETGATPETESIEAKTERIQALVAYLHKFNAWPPNCTLSETGDIQCDGDIPNTDHSGTLNYVPDDWIPFVYDGVIYYKEPLSAQQN